MGKRGLVALLNLSSWCLVMVEWLFLAVPRGCLLFVIVVFPDHTLTIFHIFVQSHDCTPLICKSLSFQLEATSSTNLSDLSIVGTCNIFVYR